VSPANSYTPLNATEILYVACCGVGGSRGAPGLAHLITSFFFLLFFRFVGLPYRFSIFRFEKMFIFYNLFHNSKK
jgi:hypothetical protein